MGMPGFGDAASWGPVVSPRDPRHDSSAEDAEEAAISLAAADVQYHLNQVDTYLVAGNLAAARAEFEKIAEVSL